jgi:hypothetical protein
MATPPRDVTRIVGPSCAPTHRAGTAPHGGTGATGGIDRVPHIGLRSSGITVSPIARGSSVRQV